MQTSLVSTGDAAAMFRRKVLRNDRPYIAVTKGRNNKQVDAWKAELLDKVAHDGKLRPEHVMSLWNLYVTGLEIGRILRHAAVKTLEDALPPAGEEKELDEWKAFFETADCDALHDKGRFVVKRGWDMVMYHFIRHQKLEQYEKVYKDSDDPHEWYTRHLAGRDLFSEPIIPWWTLDQYKEIIELVMTFLAFQGGPSPPGSV